MKPTSFSPIALKGGLLLSFLLASQAFAAACGRDAAGFENWLAGFRSEAVGEGVSEATVDAALRGASYNRTVISRDRAQGIFHQSFEQFSRRLLTPSRIAKGKALLQRHAALLGRIEQEYGVPGAILVAIWGLETGFGADNGNFRSFDALATLAYDCRRSERFRAELLDALRIVDRGYMSAAQMRGDWAGEIGQTQFLPSSYLKYAVDFDHDGKRDLIRDIPDALASTANFLKANGWRRGAGWDEGDPNFPVLLEWNKARVYGETIARLADMLAGRAGGAE
jgi:lytic murein transglycosylase